VRHASCTVRSRADIPARLTHLGHERISLSAHFQRAAAERRWLDPLFTEAERRVELRAQAGGTGAYAFDLGLASATRA